MRRYFVCRMAVAIGSFEDGELRELVEALRGAAAHDPYGEALYGEVSHGDGWGILVATLDGSRSLHYRSTHPIYGEDPAHISELIPSWAPGEHIVVMVHARAASEGSPVNLMSTHPVHAHSPWGDLYMIHNGQFLRERLGNPGGRASVQALYNDTWLAVVVLASRMEGYISRGDLESLLEAEDTGANLGVALLGGDRAQVVVGSHYSLLGDDRDADRERYYRLYRCGFPGGAVYASSTVAELHMGTRRCSSMDNGEFHSYVGSDGYDVWRFQ
ncbi:MAG: class II glutamine amidotransferase [Conexivisphaera sp.]